MTLTKREQAFMDYVRRAVGNGLDGAASCRAHPLAVARKLVDRGLLVEKWAYLCDGDGYTVQPERYVRCFCPTPLKVLETA